MLVRLLSAGNVVIGVGAFVVLGILNPMADLSRGGRRIGGGRRGDRALANILLARTVRPRHLPSTI